MLLALFQRCGNVFLRILSCSRGRDRCISTTFNVTTSADKLKCLELTLAIVKPNISNHPLLCSCILDIIKKDFYIVQSKQMKWRTGDAEKFYEEHKDRFFYNRLTTFMSSGPVFALVLAGEDAIAKWRAIMGPTKVYRAVFEAQHSIRGMYGLTDTRNSVHGSDSLSSAEREIGVFFPEFNMAEWYEKEEGLFKAGHVRFNSEHLVHHVVTE